MNITWTAILLSSLIVFFDRSALAQPPTFSRIDTVLSVSLSGGVTVGDFNADGFPDLVLETHTSTEALGLYFLRGQGDGTFAAPVQVFSGCCANVANGDVNGDGKLDLIFGAVGEEWVLLGRGDGTFGDLQRSPAPGSPRAPLVVDVNGDGKPDLALAEYRRLHAKDPKNTQFQALFAQALDKQGKHDEAVREYQALIDGTPNATWAWFSIGDIYRSLQRWGDARAAYARLLDKPNEGPEAYNRIEQTYEAEKHPDAWYAFLKERLAHSPSDRYVLARYQAVAARLKKQDEMLAFLKELAPKQQNDAVFLKTYADILQQQGHTEEALPVYRQVAKLSPLDYATRRIIATQFEAANRLPEAIGLYEEITRIPTVPAPEMVAFRLKLALLYEKNGQKTEALAQYRETLKSEPNNAAATAAVKRLGG